MNKLGTGEKAEFFKNQSSIFDWPNTRKTQIRFIKNEKDPTEYYSAVAMYHIGYIFLLNFISFMTVALFSSSKPESIYPGGQLIEVASKSCHVRKFLGMTKAAIFTIGNRPKQNNQI